MNSLTSTPAYQTGKRLLAVSGAIVSVLVAGCASLPADLGRSDVEALVIERGLSIDQKTPEQAGDRVRRLLEVPLKVDDAIRLALVNNPRLQAEYARLGFAAADVYEAGRIANPVLSFANLDTDAAGELNQRTLGLAVTFTDLITMPARLRLSDAAFMQSKQAIGAAIMDFAADTTAAYYEYVGARQVAALRDQIAKAADLGATLAQRFYAAGNINARELAMERAASGDARLEALRAHADAMAQRTKLANLLGISVGGQWSVPAQLPVPVSAEDSLDALLALSTTSRLDMAAARGEVELLAAQRGFINWSRLLGDVEIGAERERETDGSHLRGPTFELELPLFNQHRDALLRADAQWQIALTNWQALTLEVENEVSLAHKAVENSRATIDLFSEVLIPQHSEIVARAQEQLNFMLIGVFELIELKQQQYDVYAGYLAAIRDYWLARTALSRAVGNALPSAARKPAATIDVDDLIRPPPGGMDHSQHDMGDGKQMDHSQHDMGDGKPMDHSQHDMGDGKSMDHSQHDMGDGKSMDHSQHDMGDGKPMDHSQHDMGDGKPMDHSQHDRGESS